MNSCKNCFLPIDDLRTAKHCTICNALLHKECAIKEDGKFYCDVCYTVKESEGNKVEIEIPDVIRRSYIDTYDACPFKFYNEVILGVESEPHIYNQAGIDLHELYCKASNDDKFHIKEMKAIFDEKWNNYDEKLFDVAWQVNRQKLYNSLVNGIDTFYHINNKMPKPFRTEEQIIFDVGDGMPKVSSTIDRINEVNGELEVIDWKTGAVMVGQKLSNDIQAPLYIAGVEKVYKKPVRKFTFHYLEDNKERVFERYDSENYVCQVNKRQYFINPNDTVKRVQAIFTKIKNGQFNIPIKTNHMYYTCKMCHLPKLGICKGADVESWKQYNNFGR